jgi:hypothetical protein
MNKVIEEILNASDEEKVLLFRSLEKAVKNNNKEYYQKIIEEASESEEGLITVKEGINFW